MNWKTGKLLRITCFLDDCKTRVAIGLEVLGHRFAWVLPFIKFKSDYQKKYSTNLSDHELSILMKQYPMSPPKGGRQLFDMVISITGKPRNG